MLLVHGGWARSRDPRLDSLRLDLGVAGPASLAGWGQDQVHRAMPALTVSPGAWDLQLDNELLINARADTCWRRAGPAWALTGGLGGSAGKLWSQVDAGASLQLGRPTGWGPPSVRRWRMQPAQDPGLALLLAADGWLAVSDITLDGNTHVHSHSVVRQPLVGELRLGLVGAIGRWSGHYVYTVRTREFPAQLELHRYGSVGLARSF